MRQSSPDDVLHQLGLALRARRLDTGMSQEKLAELAGLHRTYISDAERGNRNISFVALTRLLSAMQITIDDFFRSYFAALVQPLHIDSRDSGSKLS